MTPIVTVAVLYAVFWYFAAQGIAWLAVNFGRRNDG